MKTAKITVNKTAERPEGIEIEIVQPENPVEERLLGYLLHPMLLELKRQNRIPYELPARFKVEHRGSGTFVASSSGGEGPYYEPPKPFAIVGVRVAGATFDIIHAEPKVAPVAAAPAAEPAGTPSPELPPAAESQAAAPAESAPVENSPDAAPESGHST